MDGSNKNKLKSEAKETRCLVFGHTILLKQVTATLEKTQGSWGHRSMLLLRWNLKVEFKSSYSRLRWKEKKNKKPQQQTKEKGWHCQTRHSPLWFLPTNMWLNTHPLPKVWNLFKLLQHLRKGQRPSKYQHVLYVFQWLRRHENRTEKPYEKEMCCYNQEKSGCEALLSACSKIC